MAGQLRASGILFLDLHDPLADTRLRHQLGRVNIGILRAARKSPPRLGIVQPGCTELRKPLPAEIDQG